MNKTTPELESENEANSSATLEATVASTTPMNFIDRRGNPVDDSSLEVVEITGEHSKTKFLVVKTPIRASTPGDELKLISEKKPNEAFVRPRFLMERSLWKEFRAFASRSDFPADLFIREIIVKHMKAEGVLDESYPEQPDSTFLQKRNEYYWHHARNREDVKQIKERMLQYAIAKETNPNIQDPFKQVFGPKREFPIPIEHEVKTEVEAYKQEIDVQEGIMSSSTVLFDNKQKQQKTTPLRTTMNGTSSETKLAPQPVSEDRQTKYKREAEAEEDDNHHGSDGDDEDEPSGVGAQQENMTSHSAFTKTVDKLPVLPPPTRSPNDERILREKLSTPTTKTTTEEPNVEPQPIDDDEDDTTIEFEGLNREEEEADNAEAVAEEEKLLKQFIREDEEDEGDDAEDKY